MIQKREILRRLKTVCGWTETALMMSSKCGLAILYKILFFVKDEQTLIRFEPYAFQSTSQAIAWDQHGETDVLGEDNNNYLALCDAVKGNKQAEPELGNTTVINEIILRIFGERCQKQFDNFNLA